MAHALTSPRLAPTERKALLNEILQQQHQFRQNMALLHGLPEPEPPTQIDVVPETVDPVVTAVESVAKAVETAAAKPADTSTAAALTSVADKVIPLISTVAPVVAPMATWKKVLGVGALLASGAAVPFVGDKIWNTKTETPQQVVVAPPTPNTSGNLLLELQKRGYGAIPTDLGEDIKKAFELNPGLRDQLIEEVKRTLEANGVKSTGTPAN